MITFMGDVALLTEGIKSEYIPKHPYIFNLEYTLSDLGTPILGKINLRSLISDFKFVFGKSPAAVSVANNHALDFGSVGYLDTMQRLQAQQIQKINEKGYWYSPQTYIVAYSMFDGCYDGDDYFSFHKEKAKEAIASARDQGAETVIVCIHWGIENHPNFNSKQQEIGHFLVDAGADLVIGHHPHCIQPMEVYKGKSIFYSLGNCIFPSFAVPSHYNENGSYERIYRLRQLSWQRKGLAVNFDEINKRVVSVDVIKLQKQKLKWIKQETDFRFLSPCKLGEFVYIARKYIAFIVSNVFIDGKIIDFQALRHELSMRKMRGK